MTIEQQIADNLATIKELEDRRRDAMALASAGYDAEMRRVKAILDALKAAQRQAISAADDGIAFLRRAIPDPTSIDVMVLAKGE